MIGRLRRLCPAELQKYRRDHDGKPPLSHDGAVDSGAIVTDAERVKYLWGGEVVLPRA
ncbi:hypothetical protein [Corynebacterium macginleyi]|uniref:hypothetical protein n=1 Tax=Corynebacterium macginleyi TaxID=38290 RepID=UPI0016051458|nr:hypothetical protein [Corynebacterium macginleyi]